MKNSSTHMRQSIVDGAPESARESANKALELGIAPLEAINRGFVPGLNSIGEQFNRGEVFLPDLVMAGEAMKAWYGRLSRRERIE